MYIEQLGPNYCQYGWVHPHILFALALICTGTIIVGEKEWGEIKTTANICPFTVCSRSTILN